MMKWEQIQGNWTSYKCRVKQQWVELTEEDLNQIDGQRNELADRIQERYGYARNEAEREIDWFCHNCTPPVDGAKAVVSTPTRLPE